MAGNTHWRLITPDQYHCPEPPASTRLQRGWHRLQRLLGVAGRPNDDNAGQLPDHGEFNRLPAIRALDAFLKGWPGDSREVRFLLDPPFSTTASIARDWAEWRQWPRLTPPTRAQLNEANVMAWWQGQQVRGPWLIDDLARYFLRTARGMVFLRRLLVLLVQGAFGTGLVVCNSWTYRFVVQGFEPGIGAVYCFAPASAALLRELGVKGTERQLARLAARARGNAGVALALWGGQHEQQALPQIPVWADDNAAFILYALLLHRGLDEPGLQQVLPIMAPERLAARLLRLAGAGLVQQNSTGWQVSPAAYGEVREFLAGREHGLDDF
ncbi:hypothetical protein PU634_06105 [Oceanimonas pelagia]|uniref:Uncharacterized protein n=1 Tax=Oceanimonas pelagia TaxID=3028314 RepID=A0AA50KQN2_9GAMM|nr:hypothetical protein [Oceanimonas pelagia]WMC11939.1 hypothetical protein PU634_06105 [Oceanimonas pelagia]